MNIRSFGVFFALTLTLSLAAQKPVPCNSSWFDDALLEKLSGQWKGTGVVMGDSVTYRITTGWELMHQFLLVHMEDVAVPSQYEAKVYIGYDCPSERYVVHWLDNFGGRFSETLGYGVQDGPSINFRFEYPDGPMINRFQYDEGSGNWHFHITSKNEKGVWITFGDIYLKKAH